VFGAPVDTSFETDSSRHGPYLLRVRTQLNDVSMEGFFVPMTITSTLANVENVIGTTFADTLIGDGAANRLEGGFGDDTIAGGAGNDTLDGGAGNDTLTFAGTTQGVTASLEGGTASGAEIGTDQITGFETVIGGSGSDTIAGDGFDNRLVGGEGNDTLTGGLGKDTLIGGAGNDTLGADLDDVKIDGGAGNDTASFADATQGVRVDLGRGFMAPASAPEPGPPQPIVVNLGNLDGSNGYVIRGDDLGDSAAGTGDINGDGRPDIVLGAPSVTITVDDTPLNGATYLVFGGAANLAALDAADGLVDGRIDADRANGDTGVVLAGDNIGDEVAGLGDVNGDGFADVLTGLSSENAGVLAFGRAAPGALDPDNDGIIDVTQIEGAGAGYFIDANAVGVIESAASAGDVNGDGVDDFIVGIPGTGLNSSYLVFGGSASLNALDRANDTVGPTVALFESAAANAATLAAAVAAATDKTQAFLDAAGALEAAAFHALTAAGEFRALPETAETQAAANALQAAADAATAAAQAAIAAYQA
ncbi:MAG: calcium-binding protein, partial [Alphaproteobacteria bacterium]|nr:calcium-binding protein [Alphaproteobacteria bacterium]